MVLSHDELAKICCLKTALLHFKLINGAKFNVGTAVTSLELLRGIVAAVRLLVDSFFVQQSSVTLLFSSYYFSYSCSFLTTLIVWED